MLISPLCQPTSNRVPLRLRRRERSARCQVRQRAPHEHLAHEAYRGLVDIEARAVVARRAGSAGSNQEERATNPLAVARPVVARGDIAGFDRDGAVAVIA
jgi:hypothetical protein